MVRYLLFLWSAACFALAPSAALHAQDAPAPNEVTVTLPETAPVVTLIPIPQMQPAATLLGSVNDTDRANASPTATVSSASAATQPPTTAATDAQSLQATLAYVYDHHPQLLAAREKLKAVDEGVAQAVSAFRPSVEAGYEIGRDRSSSNHSRWSYDQTRERSLLFRQPIFNGLEDVATLKVAKQEMKAARADLTALEQQLLFDAIVAYSAVAEEQALLELNQHRVDLLTQQRHATQVRFEVGELTKTDLAQAEARLASAKAEEQEALGAVSIARAYFLRSTGMPAPSAVSLPGVPSGLPESLEEASEQARLASPILQAAHHREKAFATGVDRAMGGLLPEVALQGRMVRSNGGNSFVSRYDNDALTLNLTFPLYQSGAEWSRLREAKNLAAQAHFLTLDTGLAVEQDVHTAWHHYLTAGSVITSSHAAADASALALEGVRQEQEFGTRSVLDVLDAQQEDFTIKVNVIRAERSHMLHAYRLLASTGKLTAEFLKLPVQAYDPTEHYDHVKYQLLGGE